MTDELRDRLAKLRLVHGARMTVEELETLSDIDAVLLEGVGARAAVANLIWAGNGLARHIPAGSEDARRWEEAKAMATPPSHPAPEPERQERIATIIANALGGETYTDQVDEALLVRDILATLHPSSTTTASGQEG